MDELRNSGNGPACLFPGVLPLHPRYTLFPYTTLFRSQAEPLLSDELGLQEGLERLGSVQRAQDALLLVLLWLGPAGLDRKSTRLNSSHVATSYAVFCWEKKYIRLERLIPTCY